MAQPASILIVDDSASTCRTLSLILERKGYLVATALDGVTAIQRVRERAFDLVLVDIKMPSLDGTATYRRIKHIRPEASVIMMTAYAVQDLVDEALRQGARAVVHKPLDIGELLALIEKARGAILGARMLVADDDRATCSTLGQMLTNRGHRVSVAHTSEEAIAAAHDGSCDIALLSMELPGLKGIETYLAIKRIRPQVVAIMMTAHEEGAVDRIRLALDSNAHAVLPKPIAPTQVVELLHDIWEGKQSRQRPPVANRRGHP